MIKTKLLNCTVTVIVISSISSGLVTCLTLQFIFNILNENFIHKYSLY